MTDVFVGGVRVTNDGVQTVAPHLFDTEEMQWVPQTVATPEGVAANVAVTNFPDVQLVSISPGAGLTAEAPDSDSVGTSSAEIVAANADRTGLVIINLSGNNVSLGLGATAVINKGITLTPYGSWVMDENTHYLGAINAVASGAGSAISIQEFSE